MINKLHSNIFPKGYVPRWEVGAYALLLVIALVMRLYDLDARAMHHDESLHATYSWYLSQGLGYQHNPMMHGPFQFYGESLAFILLGDSETTARLLYALFGTILVGLPWFLRDYLGRTGCFVSSLLLAFSPTLIYFSRFARNDILMGVWIFGIIICVWKFIQLGRPKYLYLLSALLAVSLATKETIFLTTSVIAFCLIFLALVKQNSVSILRLGHQTLLSLLLVISTLMLPQILPLTGIIQEFFGVTLVNHNPSLGAVGLPLESGKTVAVFMTAAAFLTSLLIGIVWNWRQWLICGGIFYLIWGALYSNGFTNVEGVTTGIWQSLGYWIAQQEVARGGQPWYYYLIIASLYEFLPFLFGIIGLILHTRNGDPFIKFLILWAVATFCLYSFASEKMPWLLVHLTIPMILISGFTIGKIIDTVPWKQIGWLWVTVIIVVIPLQLFIIYQILDLETDTFTVNTIIRLWIWIIVACLLATVTFMAKARFGSLETGAVLTLGLAAALLILGIHIGWRVTYKSPDTPTEMLIYTQSSASIPKIAQQTYHLARTTGLNQELSITVDSSAGFAWPWVWYFRNFTNVAYVDYSTTPPKELPNSSIILLNSNNFVPVNKILVQGFTEGEKFPHRRWFPEIYRGQTPRTIFELLIKKSSLKQIADYFVHRQLNTPMGSSDAYLYTSNNLDSYTDYRD